MTAPDRGVRPRHVLVTGGAGFIGSHLVSHLLTSDTEVAVTTLDALTYAGFRRHLAAVTGPGTPGEGRHRVIHADVRDRVAVEVALSGGPAAGAFAPDEHDPGALPPVDTVCHLAAESHVDRSIAGPAIFLDTNVTGTGVLYDACLAAGDQVQRILHVSTDEVYGAVLPPERRREDDAFAPTSPYAASKAGGDLLAHAYHATYGLPIVTLRPSNTYGPRQLPEKLIPRFVTTLLDGGRVPVYGDGQQVRDWTHVDDTVAAMALVLSRGEPGRAYNAGADDERTNLEVTRALLRLLEVGDDRIDHVTDRLGHDRRYAIDSGRIRGLGWEPRVPFEDGLAATVAWYRGEREWWEPIVRRLAAEAAAGGGGRAG